MEGLAVAVEALARRQHRGAPTWPGLTIDRYTAPPESFRSATSAVALGILVQGDGAITYRVLSGLAPSGRVHVDATVVRPCLWLTLAIDATTVRQLAADVAISTAAHPDDLTALDDDLASGLLRFVLALESRTDRTVLAPLYLREIAYRILQGAQGARMLYVAQCRSRDPVTNTIDYITAHLAEPLTVETLSHRVHLSPSAFSRMFRDATGHAPYQFVKNARLQRARELLASGVGVTAVSHAVGFVSVSHFIKQFRRRFGDTPGAYAAAAVAQLHVVRPAV